ncbi:hypothetical protein EVAR_50617_1 [Eumeta japonica]|uniref:Uncharacterized protein n=1 Tax=Eumeta variegata TaxID=151549 RepID=A0A4C1Y6N8_EUMVA|nr:hypothetical protein EVAR_50617_1 [Eumeta japonica]
MPFADEPRAPCVLSLGTTSASTRRPRCAARMRRRYPRPVRSGSGLRGSYSSSSAHLSHPDRRHETEGLVFEGLTFYRFVLCRGAQLGRQSRSDKLSSVRSALGPFTRRRSKTKRAQQRNSAEKWPGTYKSGAGAARLTAHHKYVKTAIKQLEISPAGWTTFTPELKATTEIKPPLNFSGEVQQHSASLE